MTEKEDKKEVKNRFLLDLLQNSKKPPVKLNIYSSGFPLGKGDGRGIIRGGKGDQSGILQEVYCDGVTNWRQCSQEIRGFIRLISDGINP